MKKADVEVGREYAANLGYGSAKRNFHQLRKVEVLDTGASTKTLYGREKRTEVRVLDKEQLRRRKASGHGDTILIQNRDLYAPWEEYAEQKRVADLRSDASNRLGSIQREEDEAVVDAINAFGDEHLGRPELAATPGWMEKGPQITRFSPASLTALFHAASGLSSAEVDALETKLAGIYEAAERAREAVKAERRKAIGGEEES